ncbi:hypothetical protein [Pleurocapsa sp. PCC 7319]|uniref:hypothetical protein n=1 Tax=Pleurocapsa sp. PCC 7319 TaxID=118161 RepID=UPI0003479FAE|nr:hypothetical protein [Pleurocapsa sp. PCC 7319]
MIIELLKIFLLIAVHIEPTITAVPRQSIKINSGVGVMAYQVTLNGTQQLTISNQGKQTQITLIASSPGQQQS